MPTQLYDKERIIEACIGVFAQLGYKGASTQILSQAAGVSKALLFHHFKNKKMLYFCVLGHCIDKYHSEIDTSKIGSIDFFDALEVYTPSKLKYCKDNPDSYILMRDAVYFSPKAIRQEFEQRFGHFSAGQMAAWKKQFDFVPLKKGIDRNQALELIMMTVEGFEQQFVNDIKRGCQTDTPYLESFVQKIQNFISMIRFGIEGDKEDDKDVR